MRLDNELLTEDLENLTKAHTLSALPQIGPSLFSQMRSPVLSKKAEFRNFYVAT